MHVATGDKQTPVHKLSSTVPHYLEWLEKWTKILTLEAIIFGLKMMVKIGLEFFMLKFS